MSNGMHEPSVTPEPSKTNRPLELCECGHWRAVHGGTTGAGSCAHNDCYCRHFARPKEDPKP